MFLPGSSPLFKREERRPRQQTFPATCLSPPGRRRAPDVGRERATDSPSSCPVPRCFVKGEEGVSADVVERNRLRLFPPLAPSLSGRVGSFLPRPFGGLLPQEFLIYPNFLPLKKKEKCRRNFNVFHNFRISVEVL